MQYFTQPAILEQIGRRRLVKLFQPFEQELKANNLVLPNPALENGTYFRDLATVLGRPQSLPETLRKALFTLEEAASPENDKRLWTAIHRRLPGVSVSHDCPLDRALELWFVAPDEFTQFTPPDTSANGTANASPPTSAFPDHTPTPPLSD